MLSLRDQRCCRVLTRERALVSLESACPLPPEVTMTELSDETRTPAVVPRAATAGPGRSAASPPPVARPAAADRRTQGGLPVPGALVPRPRPDHPRADAGLAVPVVHRLQPARRRRSGSAWTTTRGWSRRPALLPLAAGHVHLRDRLGAAAAGVRAGCWPWCSTGACAGWRSTARSTTCPRCSAAAWPIAVLWRQIFGTDGLVNEVLGAVRLSRPPGWIVRPRTTRWAR